jgi:hypothetical protein
MKGAERGGYEFCRAVYFPPEGGGGLYLLVLDRWAVGQQDFCCPTLVLLEYSYHPSFAIRNTERCYSFLSLSTFQKSWGMHSARIHCKYRHRKTQTRELERQAWSKKIKYIGIQFISGVTKRPSEEPLKF